MVERNTIFIAKSRYSNIYLALMCATGFLLLDLILPDLIVNENVSGR